MLEGEDEVGIAFKRTELRERASDISDHVGHLWREFDETLIEVEEGDQLKLHNTFDAASFFNPSTLTPGLTDNRFLVAVPSFLTAIGVLGTFVGLQLGLAQLNIDSSVSVEEMKVGISGVINGAKTAFTTSVFGVFLSLLFNVFEKCAAGNARKKVEELQKQIDHLFPRMNAEGQLHRIADDGRQSRESLQGLAEKIGDKMQESLIEATAGIQSGLESSLEKIMAPAIDKLVDETSDGNQKALESLVENFMDKFGEQGVQQREAMDQSTAKVGAVLEDMTSAMDGFIRKMGVSQEASGQREQELVESISSQVRFLVESTETQNRQMAELFEGRIGSLATQFEKQEQESAVRERERNDIFLKQTDAMKTGTEQLLSRVEDGFKAQTEVATTLVRQGKELQQSVESSVRASVEVTGHMKEAATELATASRNIRVAGSEIQASGKTMAGSIASAAEASRAVAEGNRESLQQLGKLRSIIQEGTESLQFSIEKMHEVVELANTAFDNMNDQQNRFLDQQKVNVETLSLKMTALLTEYADKANGCTAEHLKVWSAETTGYASEMNHAMKALNSIVDEIEVKVGR